MGNSVERLKRFDDFLSEKQLLDVQDFFQKNVFWTYGWQSLKDQVPFGHWNHDFLKVKNDNQEDCEQTFFEDANLAALHPLWRKLKEEYFKDHALVRCYANAHTFGIEGYPHTDSRKSGNYTAIFYLNPVWKPEWAGETVFVNDMGDIFQSVLPKPGRMVIFDGNIVHAARGVSRVCPALRVTLMFKTLALGMKRD